MSDAANSESGQQRRLAALEAHKFKKGQSGNPLGNARGFIEWKKKCRDAATLLLPELVKKAEEDTSLAIWICEQGFGKAEAPMPKERAAAELEAHAEEFTEKLYAFLDEDGRAKVQKALAAIKEQDGTPTAT